MKTRNVLCGFLIAAALPLAVSAGFAQTTQYLFTGSETNVTLPPGNYEITAYGAQGGDYTGMNETANGGLGAEMEGVFEFTTTTTLTLLVGGTGQIAGTYDGAGGGGGSFVVNGTTPLVIAGGGGGASDAYARFGPTGGNGLTGTSGGNGGSGVDGGGATGGNGGSGGGGDMGSGDSNTGGAGGGGYSGNGTNSGSDVNNGGTGGNSYLNGGSGGKGYYENGNFGQGGYGGGGGCYEGGGGGGGYSGGGGGGELSGGGGGGSIIDSSALVILAEVSGVASPDDSPNGEIIITLVTEPILTNIVISPINPTIGTGASETFTATGSFSDGSQDSLASTNGLVWSSSSPDVATIDTNGVATGLTGGTTIITATDDGVTNITTLTVQVPFTVQATNQFLCTGSETNITLPPGTYDIIAYGAQGGQANSVYFYGGGGILVGGGSSGAEIEAEFNFTQQVTLTLLVGAAGTNGGELYEYGVETYSGGGGGGGSFVVNGSTPLLVAGGGGGEGGGNGGIGEGNNGNVGPAGGSGSGGYPDYGGYGGTGGAGGSYPPSYPVGYPPNPSGGGGGGGFNGDGGGDSGDAGGYGGSSFLDGGAGGEGNFSSTFGGDGGYGGGGGGGIPIGNDGGFGGGGGGGYSGGGGGSAQDPYYIGGGGGGGSFIDSSAIATLTGISGAASPDDSPHGEIIIIVVPKPIMLTVAAPTSGLFGFNITGPTNATFVVQACTNLANPVWIPIATNTLNNGTNYFNDAQWMNQPCRYYRVNEP